MNILSYKEFLNQRIINDYCSTFLLEFDKTTYSDFIKTYLGYSDEFVNLAGSDTIEKIYEFLDNNHYVFYLSEDSFLQRFQNTAKKVLKTSKEKLTDVGKKFYELASNAKTFLSKLIDILKKGFSLLWDKIEETVKKMAEPKKEKVKEMISKNIKELNDSLKEDLKEEVNYFKELFNYVKDLIVKKTMDFIRILMKPVVDLFKKDESDVVEESYFVKLNKNFIMDLVETFYFLNEGISKVFPFLKTLKNNLEKAPIFKYWEEMFEGIEHFLGKNMNKFFTLSSKILNKTLKAPGPKDFNVMGNIIGSVISFFSLKSFGKETISVILNKIGNVFMSAISIFPYINGFIIMLKVYSTTMFCLEILSEILKV